MSEVSPDQSLVSQGQPYRCSFINDSAYILSDCTGGPPLHQPNALQLRFRHRYACCYSDGVYDLEDDVLYSSCLQVYRILNPHILPLGQPSTLIVQVDILVLSIIGLTVKASLVGSIVDEIGRVIEDEADRAASAAKVVSRGQVDVTSYSQRRSGTNLAVGSALN